MLLMLCSLERTCNGRGQRRLPSSHYDRLSSSPYHTCRNWTDGGGSMVISGVNNVDYLFGTTIIGGDNIVVPVSLKPASGLLSGPITIVTPTPRLCLSVAISPSCRDRYRNLPTSKGVGFFLVYGMTVAIRCQLGYRTSMIVSTAFVFLL